MADAWTIIQTVFSVISALGIVFAANALFIERIRSVRNRDYGRIAANPNIMGCFSVKKVGWLSSLMGKQTEVLRVTTFGGLIEAGDRGLWTSAALDHIQEGHSEISWVPLWEAIFKEVKRASEKTQEWQEKKDIGIFLQRENQAQKLMEVAAAMTERRKLYQDGELFNCCRELDMVDKEDQKVQGYESRVLDATKEKQGLGKVQDAWFLEQKPCIATTREELAALSLVLATWIKINNYANSLDAIGAFGLSLYASQNGGTWKLSLAQGSRIPRDMPSLGSGYTTLMAKHLACGSIPFAQTSRWVKSVYVTDEILQAIKNGSNIQDVRKYGGQSLEFLRRLPTEKEIDAYFGVAVEFADPACANSKGLILKPNNEEVGHWHRAAAGIAFGGLVPQAAKNVTEAIKFTVAGASGDCVEELEELVNELHKGDRDRGLFGTHVTSRCLAHELIDFANYTKNIEHGSLRDRAVIFARYMNLLERMTAVCETPNVSCCTDGNGRACKCCLGGCPANSVKTPCKCPRCRKRLMDYVFDAACTLIQNVYYLAVRKDSSSLNLDEKRLLNQDLGEALKDIRQRLEKNRIEKEKRQPIPLEDCATVVRCILAAWASAVPVIDLKERTLDLNIDDPSYRAAPAPIRMATLDDLPPVLAFG
jgi:hypothetical protein